MWKASSVLFSAIIATAVLASEPAYAQSCAQLQAELGSLSGGGGGALASARQRLNALQRQSRANGCGSASNVGKPRACAGIQSKITTVSGQIAALEARGGGGNGGSAERRRRIQAQMARLKCGQEAPARQQEARRPAAPVAGERGSQQQYVVHNNRLVQTQRSEGGGLFSLLFGGQRGREGPAAAPGGDATLASLQPGPKAVRGTSERPEVDADGKVTYARHFFGGGSYRTLCVRSCDGYYFPISTVTHRGNFGRDEAVCQSLCPNTEVALYAHSAGSESENMYRVADGRSYRELETAFQYRKTYNAACTCTFAAKMVQTADGKEVIDVEGSRAAYSPARTANAAAAIDGIIAPGEGLAAVEPAVIEQGDGAGVVPASIDPSAAGPLVRTDAGAAVPAAGTEAAPVEAQGTGAGNAAASVDSPAHPLPAVDDGSAPPIQPTASTATAPRGSPIPAATPEPLRVRTIGPEFLQEGHTLN